MATTFLATATTERAESAVVWNRLDVAGSLYFEINTFLTYCSRYQPVCCLCKLKATPHLITILINLGQSQQSYYTYHFSCQAAINETEHLLFIYLIFKSYQQLKGYTFPYCSLCLLHLVGFTNMTLKPVKRTSE